MQFRDGRKDSENRGGKIKKKKRTLGKFRCARPSQRLYVPRMNFEIVILMVYSMLKVLCGRLAFSET